MHRKLLLIATLQLLTLASCDEVQDYYARLFPSNSPRRCLPFLQLTEIDNRRCDVHYVTTSDGYILTIFRLYPNENCTTVHPIPVVSLHGLYLSGTDCIIPGLGKANCYILTDKCYEVWVVNFRGNQFGRNHTTLNPDEDEEFWDFTFDDMAMYDLPATIDYIITETGQPQVNIIAHSQGYTVFLLMCSQRVEYNDKVKYCIAMSAATWLQHTRLLALYLQAVLALIFRSALCEIFRYGGPVQKIAEIVCGKTDLSYPACSVFIFALFGYNNFTICPDTVATAVCHQPSGTSCKNFLRWGQIMNYQFCLFDYGPAKNLQVYGSLYPPLYDLSKYRVKTHFISSNNDYVCDPRDLQTLMEHLTGCTNCTKCILSRQYFNHIDYIYSDEIPDAIAPIYLEYYETGQAICT